MSQGFKLGDTVRVIDKYSCHCGTVGKISGVYCDDGILPSGDDRYRVSYNINGKKKRHYFQGSQLVKQERRILYAYSTALNEVRWFTKSELHNGREVLLARAPEYDTEFTGNASNEE